MSASLKLAYINSLFALAYFGGGYLGHMLSTAPSLLSPIWPSAGIALAGILSYGRKILPGLLAGILAAQIYAFLDLIDVSGELTVVWIATAASIAACLGPWIGAGLINRSIGRHNPLLEDQHILWFFSLTLVSCLISASIGTSFLYIFGVISIAEIALNWCTWWIGDAIGSVIFAPLVLLFVGTPRHIWRQRRKFVAYPLLISLLLVVIAFVYSRRLENQRIVDLFENQVNLTHTSLQAHFDDDLLNNRLLKALFDGAEAVNAYQFRLFAETIFSKHPELETLEWIPQINNDDRQQFEQQTGIPIRERDQHQDWVAASTRRLYLPITYWYGNEQNIGFDVASNPQLLAAINKAAASGNSVLAWDIIDNDKQPGFALYSPVYAKDKPVNSSAERQQYFLGVVANVFKLSKEVTEIFHQLPNTQLTLSLYDHEQLLYSNARTQDLVSSPLRKMHTLNMADITWTVIYQPSQAFYAQQHSWTVWWLLSGSFLLCCLTSFGLMLMSGRTARIEDLVALKTRDLLRSNQALNTEIDRRKRHENELRTPQPPFNLTRRSSSQTPTV